MDSGNRFRDTTLTESETIRAKKAFANIKYFKLDNTLLPWEDVNRPLPGLISKLRLIARSSPA